MSGASCGWEAFLLEYGFLSILCYYFKSGVMYRTSPDNNFQLD